MVRDLRGIYIIWLRDVRRFLRDKPRIVGATAQPALFLLLLGTGLGKNMEMDYLTFIYPGIIGMTLLFTSVFSAISIVWDREIGFLKEVMVAPVSRWAVAVGKAFGGATVALLQGCLMFVFAPFVHVKLSFIMILTLLPVFFLIAFSLTSLGIMVASRMTSMQGFSAIMNFLVLPMFFLSSSMFPITNLPIWMEILVKINPLTYGVDVLRGIIINKSNYSIFYDLVVLSVFGALMITSAVISFTKTEQ